MNTNNKGLIERIYEYINAHQSDFRSPITKTPGHIKNLLNKQYIYNVEKKAKYPDGVGSLGGNVSNRLYNELHVGRYYLTRGIEHLYHHPYRINVSSSFQLLSFEQGITQNGQNKCT